MQPEVESPIEVEIQVTIPFHDADPMGVTWHGNYFRYLESARAALLNLIGYGYREMVASGYLWPVIDARIKYVKPTTFGQSVKVKATLEEYLNRLKIRYTISDSGTGVRLTKAYTVQVAVNAESQEMCFCSPDVFIEKVRQCVE